MGELCVVIAAGETFQRRRSLTTGTIYAIQISRTCTRCITNFANLERETCHAKLESKPSFVMQRPHLYVYGKFTVDTIPEDGRLVGSGTAASRIPGLYAASNTAAKSGARPPPGAMFLTTTTPSSFNSHQSSQRGSASCVSFDDEKRIAVLSTISIAKASYSYRCKSCITKTNLIPKANLHYKFYFSC